MNVAIVSESSANEAGIEILTAAILGTQLRRPEIPLRARGWPHVLAVLPAIVKSLYYRSDAHGIVVVVDSDDSPVAHTDVQCSVAAAGCRLCAVSATLKATIDGLNPIGGRAAFDFAAGLAVPCLEAWLLCGRDPHVSEATWINAQRNRQRAPYDRRDLKIAVYGTDRPSLAHEALRTVEESLRLATDLDPLRRSFAIGFGALFTSLNRWRT